MSQINDPAPSGKNYSLADANGHHVLIYPIEHVPVVHTTNGEKDAIRINVLDITTGEVHLDALWFGAIIGSLKRQVGQLVLGTVGKGTAKVPGQNPPWLLAAVTDDQVRNAANKWLEQNPGVLQGTPQVVINAAPGGIAGALA